MDVKSEADLLRAVQLSGRGAKTPRKRHDDSPCFPCFMKPIGGGGMSAGINTHLLSGRMDDVPTLFQQAGASPWP
eukprot:606802-Prymnesium_polylepis.1